ncbi:MAG: glycerate kinase [Ruminococcaceae bacterium]|nr:glycerate kinase [Oscillospiraceae bacterium]
MKIVIAIDSFKGSLSSYKAGEAVKNGIKRVFEDAEIIVRPLADGGEGTVEALTEGLSGKITFTEVSGPLGEKVIAIYGIAGDTAIMEISQAAGLTLVPQNRRNPLYTTTYGVGEMIKDAINKGIRHFIIGIGGSATNDGGVGMLQALGFGFFDEDNNPVPRGADGLRVLKRITDDNAMPQLKECTFGIACDVSNPLCGALGASRIYGPQKGADEEMTGKMDSWLYEYAELTKKLYPDADASYPGAGAAGGLGFAFMSFLGGSLKKGSELILSETKLSNYLENADFVITGEGRLDSQSVMGKAPVGVAALAKEKNIPVLAFSGCATPDAGICNQYGVDAFFPILREPVTLEEAMEPEYTYRNLSDTTEQVFRVIKIFNKKV